MTNPYQPLEQLQRKECSIEVWAVIYPLTVLVLGAVSSSVVGFALAYELTGGALGMATGISTDFFVAGAICSSIPAFNLRKQMVAREENADPSGYVLFAVFCMPIASLFLICVLLAAVILIVVLIASLSAS